MRPSAREGYAVTYGVWVGVHPEAFHHAFRVWREPEYGNLQPKGALSNSIPPWGLLAAPVTPAVKDPKHTPYRVSDSDHMLSGVLGQECRIRTSSNTSGRRGLCRRTAAGRQPAPAAGREPAPAARGRPCSDPAAAASPGRAGSRSRPGRAAAQVPGRPARPPGKERVAARVSPADSSHSAARSCSARSRSQSVACSSARSSWRTRW
jgi:hypothetical protein